MKKKDKDYFVVAKEALPEVFIKVVEAKRLLEYGICKTAMAASEAVGISRSAFYKYKDSIYPLYSSKRGQTVTIALDLTHKPGLLSSVLNEIGNADANVLTINQTIPINGVANVTITLETTNVSFYEALNEIDGVRSLKIIARE